MRALLTAIAAAALATGAALAHEAPPPVAPAQAEGLPSHETCLEVMGRKMDGKPRHDHTRDKTAAAHRQKLRPLTKAEMERRHEACARKLNAAETPSN